jgi:AbrB family looped-hinge helix DNA binding protein
MNEHFRTLVSTVTSKGQTTIPKEFRDAFGIKEGTPLRWHVENGQLIVRPKTKRLEDFAGMLGVPPNGARLKVEDMDDAIADAVAEEFERSTR